ncbi:Dolichyl-phosphate-mannose--protein mannosyltransferase 4 [Porphyridium purpureum]|uniref:Dolichyl-phosphate-mannose--protein mannosyltransferase 4 n=1 Tax=Porphyridium purpureum TaxID=35688 RepID=A0A5J4Z8L8_PORPP|nr:Dolichyl-phosphate-mannose--protein mannosyltransferase 4 [Porphyridium purpureum]|eukprot:POR9778..scf295_1
MSGREESGGSTASALAPAKENAFGASKIVCVRAGDNVPSRSWRLDAACCIALLVVSVLLRTRDLGHPDTVVFDEVHFGKFVHAYMTGEHYFDIHPPLGKLTIAGVVTALGYRYDPAVQNATAQFDKVGLPFAPEFNVQLLRAVPAAAGALVVPTVFLVATELQFSLETSLLVASAALLDSMLIIQSRLLLIDTQLVLFVSLSLLCALKLWRTDPLRHKVRRLALVCATAVFGSLALGVKWTALSYPGLIGVVSFFGYLFPHAFLSAQECSLATLVAIMVYAFPFWLHFRLLPRSGPGDGHMDLGFRRRLIGSDAYDATLRRRWFFIDFLELNARMYIANKNITGKHPWETKWYQWIVNARGLLYYAKRGAAKHDPEALIYLLGNPCAVWVSMAAIVVLTLLTMFQVRRRQFELPSLPAWRTNTELGGFLLIGWTLNLLPFILVERSAFLYHYLPGLLFAELALGYLVDCIPWRGARVLLCAVLVSAFIAAFVYWSPWTYAWPLSLSEHRARRWLAGWT